MNKVIEIRNLKYKYSDERQALKGVDLAISKGESVGIIGANGAGKSTLLLNIMGILFPSEGEILVKDIPLSKKNLHKIREAIGMVFQNPDDQLFMTTVYEDVAFGPRNYKVPEEEVDKRVKKALETVGISHLIDRPPYKLSGGEKGRAAIATVLAMEPEILIMDEPTAALDPKSRRRLINLLKDLSYTKIITTHDLDMVLDLCERTVVLRDGKVVADGKTEEILRDSKLLDSCDLELPLALQSCPICNKK
jgi:cobalt/nickel transport system ATP-binding protein